MDKSEYFYGEKYQAAQQVVCMTTDTCLSADQGVTNSTPAWSHVFLEINCEIYPDHSPHFADSRRVVIKYVHEILFNHSVKLVQEKVLLDAIAFLT